MFKKVLPICIAVIMVFTCTVNFDAASKPAKVKGVKASSIGKTTITLKWDKTKRAKYYRVYRITKTYKSHGKKKYKYKIVGKTKKRSYKIKNLKSGKKYRFRVCAVNGKKRGKLSDIKYVTTKTAKKVAGTKKQIITNYDLNIKISKVSDSSFVIRWSKVTGATSYDVKVYDYDRGKTIKSTTVKTTSYTVSGVSPGEYKVYVSSNGDFYTEESKYFELQGSSSTSTQYTIPTQSEMNQFSKQLANKINADRQKNGLSTLKWDDELAAIAMERAKECAEIGKITHDLPKLKDPSYSLRVFNYHNYQQYITYDEDGVPIYSGDYPGMPGVAENMYGYGYDLNASLSENAAGAHQGYMESPGHKNNILHSRATAMGIATYIDTKSYANGDEYITIYNVEMFELP